MNSLSLFLYFADVLPRAADIFFVISLLLGMASLFAIVLAGCWYNIFEARKSQRGGDDYYEDDIANCRFWYQLGKVFFPICLVVLIISLLVPSRDTLYLIAGSEFSEVAVTSERGQELIAKVNAVLDAQLDKLME